MSGTLDVKSILNDSRKALEDVDYLTEVSQVLVLYIP